MCPWRSWIARWTPTPKVAGSNPVGHTKTTKNIAFSVVFPFENHVPSVVKVIVRWDNLEFMPVLLLCQPAVLFPG